MDDEIITSESRVDVLQRQLSAVVGDLQAGRITAAEANRITKEVGAELRVVEAAMRAAKLSHSVEDHSRVSRS